MVALGMLARLPSGMLGLSLVLAVAASHSFAVAGVVAAGYSIALALAAPLRARAVDQRGAIWAIRRTALIQSVCSCATCMCLLLHLPIGSVFALALGCGLSAPPITPAMRAFWTLRFPKEPTSRAVASSLESMVVDVSYIAGPGLVSLILLAGPAPLSLLCVAALRVATSTALTSLAPIRAIVGLGSRARSDLRTGRLGLRSPALRALLPVALLAFGSISAIEVAISAVTQDNGHKAAAGLLIGVLSVGGVIGGLLRGQLAQRTKAATSNQLITALTFLTLAWAAPLAVATLPLLAGVLLVAGVVMNPMISLHYDLLGDRVTSEHRTEAFGWMTAANAVGAALGASAAGALCAANPAAGFAGAATMTGLAAVGALLAKPLLSAP